MMKTYGLSIFGIAFEVALVIKKGRKYLNAFQERQKLTNTLSQFKTITEISEKDKTCAICFVEMQSAKKLQCGHLFHEDCIRYF